MNTPVVLRRELTFYSIRVVTGSGKKARSDSLFDWAAALQAIADAPAEVVPARAEFLPYEFEVLSGVGLPTLAVYRPLGSNSYVLKRPGATKADDLDGLEGFELMNATAFFFLPAPRGVVVMLQGDRLGGSPPVRALQTLAGLVAPQTVGRWRVEPIYIESQYQELVRSDGVDRMRAKLRGHAGDDLFTADPTFAEFQGLTSLANSVAKKVGVDVDVSLTIKIPSELRTRTVEQRLKGIVVEEANPSRMGRGRVTARARTRRGLVPQEETLTMARHELAAKIEVEVPEGEAVRFSSFVAAAADDLAKNARRYAELALGGSDEEGPVQNQ